MTNSFLETPRWKILVVAAATVGIGLFHLVIPLGEAAAGWLHPLFLKLYYVPVLIAAACLGVRGTLVTAFAVSMTLALHVLLRPGGAPIWKADHIAERGRHFDPEVVDAFLAIPFRDWAAAAARNGVILREA